MKALALYSGGLDSMLAIKLVREQDIEVEALYMDIGFGGTKADLNKLQSRAEEAGASFRLVDVQEIYLKEVLFSPKYGYGKHFNPCIDCHGFMFKTALKLLKELKADFVISGEVVGQRPMSQRSDAMRSVSRLALNEENLILRPLCAKNLAPTKPELEGWIDREKLLDISGRGRQVQLKLAKEYGFSEYESPSGGCLLTLAAFGDKIKDFIKYDTLEKEDIALLKFGRHLRLPDGAKLVVGRNAEDNAELLKLQNSKHSFVILDGITGPVSLLSNDASQADKSLAGKIILSYTKAQKNQAHKLNFKGQIINEMPFETKDEARKYFIL